jgi:hypothetical protein
MVVLRAVIWVVLAIALSACDHEDPCDEGVSAGPGSCKPAPDDDEKDSGKSKVDSGSEDEKDAGSDSGASEASLGKDCLDDGDCASDAPFCARMPGTPKGYCTIKDCSTADDKCPAGYKCFNLGIAAVPPFCMKQ